MILTVGAVAGVDAIRMKFIAVLLLVRLYSTCQQALRVLNLLYWNYLRLFLNFVNATAWSAVKEEIRAAMIILSRNFLRRKYLILPFISTDAIIEVLMSRVR